MLLQLLQVQIVCLYSNCRYRYYACTVLQVQIPYLYSTAGKDTILVRGLNMCFLSNETRWITRSQIKIMSFLYCAEHSYTVKFEDYWIQKTDRQIYRYIVKVNSYKRWGASHLGFLLILCTVITRKQWNRKKLLQYLSVFWCYKANSFTRHLLNHQFSETEMGLFTIVVSHAHWTF